MHFPSHSLLTVLFYTALSDPHYTAITSKSDRIRAFEDFIRDLRTKKREEEEAEKERVRAEIKRRKADYMVLFGLFPFALSFLSTIFLVVVVPQALLEAQCQRVAFHTKTRWKDFLPLISNEPALTQIGPKCVPFHLSIHISFHCFTILLLFCVAVLLLLVTTLANCSTSTASSWKTSFRKTRKRSSRF